MDILSTEQFTTLIQDKHATILSDSKAGPKVLKMQNGDIVKIFYDTLKIPLSMPHALRFNRSAQILKTAGFLAPQIKCLKYYPAQKAYVLIYGEIPGQDFRSLSSKAHPAVLGKLPSFLASLHQKGIFYRGIHLGNVLLTPNQEIGLVDITNVSKSNKPLSLKQCAKNLAHFVYYWRDIVVFTAYSRRRFLDEYARAAKLDAQELKQLRHLIALRLKSKS